MQTLLNTERASFTGEGVVRLKSGFLVSILLSSAAVPAWASEPTAVDGGPAEDAAVEEVIVTAARVPTPITALPNTVRVLDRETLDTQLAVSSSLLDSLSFSIPSFAPGRQKMTSTGESLRGRTPLYLVDGVPQSTPLRDGKRSGYTIDPAFLDRVEVIYGANAIQGVGATGGVINYVTVSAPKSGEWLRQATLELTTDDFEDNGLHGRASLLAAKKTGRFDFVLGAAHDARDLYYDGEGRPVGVDTIQGDTMDSKAWSGFAKLGYDFTDDQRLEFTANLFDMQGDGDYRGVPGIRAAGVPATSVKGVPLGDPAYNEASDFALTYRHRDLFAGDLTVQAFHYDFYALYGGDVTPAFQDAAIAPVGTLVDQSALSSEKQGVKLTYARQDVFWPGLQVVGGADWLRDETRQELAQTGRVWVPTMIYRGWAPFLQLEQALFDERVRVSGGARYEHAELDVPDFTTIASANSTFVDGGAPTFGEVLVNAGLVVEPVDGLTAFVSYAEGFNMPDAGLILRAVNTPGQSVDNLVDLQPVIADNLEVGASWRRDGLNLSASYFWSASDFGSRIQVIGGVGVVRRERTEIEGFELAASYDFVSGVRVGGNYAALEGRYDSDGDSAPDKDLDGRNISPDRMNLYVEAPFGERVTGRLQASRLFDRRFDGGLPQFDFDGYTLVDAVATYDAGSAGRFTLAVSNLLDEYYATYFSQTGTFVTDKDYVAGRGRAITLRWQGRF